MNGNWQRPTEPSNCAQTRVRPRRGARELARESGPTETPAPRNGIAHPVRILPAPPLLMSAHKEPRKSGATFRPTC